MLHVVSALITNAKGYLFLQRRPSRKEYGGLLETPGGKQETDENVQQAVRRELYEELGLHTIWVNKIPILSATFHPPMCREMHSIGLYQVVSYSPLPTESKEDATDLGFYDIWKLRDEECTPSLQLYKSYLEIIRGYKL